MSTGKFSSSAFAVFLIDGYSLLAAKVKNVTYKREALEEDSTGLGDSVTSQLPNGLSKYSAAQAGAFFDDTANGFHLAMIGRGALSRIWNLAVTGNAIGQRAIGAQGMYTPGYEVLSQAGTLTKANATYEITAAIEDGVIVQEWATRADDWDTAAEAHSVDSLASSANGGAGYLHVSNFLGPNAGTGLIRHSDDNLNWSTLVTFAAVNAPGAQRVAVAGTVKRYLSFKWSGFGNLSASASTSASISPSVSTSSSASPSLSPSSSRSPSASTSLSPSASISPSASTSLSPSASLSPSVSASASTSPSLSPSVSASASVSPSSGGSQASSVTVFAMFARL